MTVIDEKIEEVKKLPDLENKKKGFDEAPNKRKYVRKEFRALIRSIDVEYAVEFTEALIDFLDSYNQETSQFPKESMAEVIKTTKNAFTNIYYGDELMAHTGGVLKESFVSLLSNDIIDVDKIRSDNPKQRVKDLKKVYTIVELAVKDKTLSSQDKTLIQNVINIYQELEEDAETNLDSKILDLDLEVNLGEFFGASSLKQLHKRRNVYVYWKSIHNKFNKLFTELEKDENKELLKGVDIAALNYVVKYDTTELTLNAIPSRAFEFVKKFFATVLDDAAIINFDEVDGEYYFSERSRTTEDGDKSQMAEIDETKITSKEYLKALDEPMEIDVLGYVYAVSTLGGTDVVLNKGEKAIYKNEIRKTLKSMLAVSDDDLDFLNDSVEEFLEGIEKVSKLKDAFLPIYFSDSKDTVMDFTKTIFNTEGIKEVDSDEIKYKTEIDSDKVTENINKFLKNLRDEVVEELGARPSLMLEEGKGASKGKKDMSEPSAYSNYTRGMEAKYKNMEANITKILNLVDELYIKPMDGKFSRGISFRYDENLLYDVINRPDSPFKIQRQLNKNAEKEGIDFINLDELQSIRDLMKAIKVIDSKKGKTKTNIDKLKVEIRDMINVLDDILVTSDEVQDEYAETITRDLASLYYAMTEIDIQFEGFSSKKEYDARGVSDYNDNSALKEIINFIIKNINLYGMADLNEERKVVQEIKGIRDFFSNLSKSNSKLLLQAHDHIRILKGQETYYNFLDNEDIDSVAYFINKMSDERNIDLSSMEVDSIIKSVDSFANISEEHGISTEDVYLVKAHFR